MAKGNERVAELLAIAQRKKRGTPKAPKDPEPPPELDDEPSSRRCTSPKAKARERQLAGEDLRAWRQRHVPPHMKDFAQWMDALEPTLFPDESLAKTIRYYRNHWDALFRFVDRPEIPMDNSASERELQNVAKLRQAMIFASSGEGAHQAATLLGIVATCRALEADPKVYLVWALERRGTHRDHFGPSAAETSPAAYKVAIA